MPIVLSSPVTLLETPVSAEFIFRNLSAPASSVWDSSDPGKSVSWRLHSTTEGTYNLIFGRRPCPMLVRRIDLVLTVKVYDDVHVSSARHC